MFGIGGGLSTTGSGGGGLFSMAASAEAEAKRAEARRRWLHLHTRQRASDSESQKNPSEDKKRTSISLFQNQDRKEAAGQQKSTDSSDRCGGDIINYRALTHSFSNETDTPNVKTPPMARFGSDSDRSNFDSDDKLTAYSQSPKFLTCAKYETQIDSNGDEVSARKRSYFLDNVDTDPPDESAIAEYRASRRRVIINVGGEKHEILWKTLERFPNSRLGQLSFCRNHKEIMQVCDDYSLRDNEFFFDRHPQSFGCALNMYRTGNLHMQEDMCVMNFAEDLRYWGINENFMDACCQYRYYQKKDHVEDEIRKMDEDCMDQNYLEDYGDGRFVEIRRKLWDLLEKPHTSRAARIITLISVFFIVMSTVGLTLNTLPELQENYTYYKKEIYNNTEISTKKFELKDNSHLEKLEVVCIVWFSLEYILRFFGSPDRKKFLKAPMNNIDLVAILPFYISKILNAILNNENMDDQLVSVRKTLQIFRILRILRVLKLARHSVGLQSLGYTLRRSYKELGLLMMFVALGVLLFSSLAYFAEKDDNAKMFKSIPTTFWWAIITMTTVGYGDMTPITPLGQIIGSCCCLCGVLVVALPIPIIVNNFADYYKEQMNREKALKRKEEIEKTKGNEGILAFKLEDMNLDSAYLRNNSDKIYLSVSQRRSDDALETRSLDIQVNRSSENLGQKLKSKEHHESYDHIVQDRKQKLPIINRADNVRRKHFSPVKDEQNQSSCPPPSSSTMSLPKGVPSPENQNTQSPILAAARRLTSSVKKRPRFADQPELVDHSSVDSINSQLSAVKSPPATSIKATLLSKIGATVSRTFSSASSTEKLTDSQRGMSPPPLSSNVKQVIYSKQNPQMSIGILKKENCPNPTQAVNPGSIFSPTDEVSSSTTMTDLPESCSQFSGIGRYSENDNKSPRSSREVDSGIADLKLISINSSATVLSPNYDVTAPRGKVTSGNIVVNSQAPNSLDNSLISELSSDIVLGSPESRGNNPE